MTDEEFPFEVADRSDAADRLTLALRAGTSVSSVVPIGFAAYVRICHPAWRISTNNEIWNSLFSGNDSKYAEPTRWEDVAIEAGCVVHPQMSWYCLCGNQPLVNVLNHPDNPLSPGVVWVDPPHEGTLTRDIASCLADVLAMHCFSDSCWFGIWEGFGYTDSLPETASFNALDQRYLLYRAPLAALQSSFYPNSYGFQTANMVWPDNEAWYLASPFNCASTYIGGSEELVSAILADRTLEAYRIEPHKSIWKDTINPPKEEYPVLKPIEIPPDMLEWIERGMPISQKPDHTVNRSGIIYVRKDPGDDHSN